MQHAVAAVHFDRKHRPEIARSSELRCSVEVAAAVPGQRAMQAYTLGRALMSARPGNVSLGLYGSAARESSTLGVLLALHDETIAYNPVSTAQSSASSSASSPQNSSPLTMQFGAPNMPRSIAISVFRRRHPRNSERLLFLGSPPAHRLHRVRPRVSRGHRCLHPRRSWQRTPV